MKLIMLSTSASYHPGPRARWLPLAHVAQRHGIDVELLCLHPDYVNSTTPHRQHHGVSIRHVAQMHIDRHERPLHGHTLIRTALHASISLARQAIRAQPHVITVCKAQPINGLAAILARQRTRAQLILDVDDCEHESHQFARTWHKALVARVERILPQMATSTSVASQWQLDQLANAGHHTLAHIPNGITAIPPLPHRIAGLPAQYIAYVGRIAFNTHAVDLLIDAYAQMRTTLPLVIAGSGPDASAMQHRIAEHGLDTRCIWLGQVDFATAQAIIAHAHATVDPVRNTPGAAARYPLKIIESLAHGVPVVTSPIGDRATMIGEHGLLVTAGDAASLARALDDIATQSRWPRANGQARVAHLTWEQIGPQWLAHHRLSAIAHGVL